MSDREPMMDKFIPENQVEFERTVGYARIIEQYFPEDMEFTAGMDEEELAGFLYGQLLEIGEDPDKIFNAFGITEELE